MDRCTEACPVDYIGSGPVTSDNGAGHDANGNGHRVGPYFRRTSLGTRLRAASRLVAAGYAERERIEKDLHDGAQQRLTVLRIRLARAAEGFRDRGDQEAGAALSEFGEEVEHAIDELREFAHGVYPVSLTSGGLGPALASASTHSHQPVRVLTRDVRRYTTEVETAVYFSCLAVMHNAAKHAGPAQVTVRVWDTADALHFSVQDTGRGFQPARTVAGAGITTVYDRIGAVGGTVAIESAPARGTRVEGTVPHDLALSRLPPPRTGAEIAGR